MNNIQVLDNINIVENLFTINELGKVKVKTEQEMHGMSSKLCI